MALTPRKQAPASRFSDLLTEEFDDRLQSTYGIYAEEGRVPELDDSPT